MYRESVRSAPRESILLANEENCITVPSPPPPPLQSCFYLDALFLRDVGKIARTPRNAYQVTPRRGVCSRLPEIVRQSAIKSIRVTNV